MTAGLTMGESMVAAGGVDAEAAPPMTAPGTDSVVSPDSKTKHPEPTPIKHDRTVMTDGRS